jgi:hypothetical protein
LNELGGEHREAVVLLIGRAIVDDEIAVLDKARISQSIYKSYSGTDAGAGAHVDPANDRKAGLCVHRERPGNQRRGRPAKEHHQPAPIRLDHGTVLPPRGSAGGAQRSISARSACHNGVGKSWDGPESF